ncbi:MAG: NUDIX hydrolase [Minisyncoccia bacterium]
MTKPTFELKGESFINKIGIKIETTYFEANPLENLEGIKLGGARGWCFSGGKFVVVRSGDHWGTPGGEIEKGETMDQALEREVMEEASMRIVRKELIGYQDFYTPTYTSRQVIFFCEVEPLDKFTHDPDEDITEVKLIDPKDYKEYFDWGIIADHVMKKSLEILSQKQV